MWLRILSHANTKYKLKERHCAPIEIHPTLKLAVQVEFVKFRGASSAVEFSARFIACHQANNRVKINQRTSGFRRPEDLPPP
jgi:hypothetical protein